MTVEQRRLVSAGLLGIDFVPELSGRPVERMMQAGVWDWPASDRCCVDVAILFASFREKERLCFTEAHTFVFLLFFFVS